MLCKGLCLLEEPEVDSVGEEKVYWAVNQVVLEASDLASFLQANGGFRVINQGLVVFNARVDFFGQLFSGMSKVPAGNLLGS